jgi:hypothetical protein
VLGRRQVNGCPLRLGEQAGGKHETCADSWPLTKYEQKVAQIPSKVGHSPMKEHTDPKCNATNQQKPVTRTKPCVGFRLVMAVMRRQVGTESV